MHSRRVIVRLELSVGRRDGGTSVRLELSVEPPAHKQLYYSESFFKKEEDLVSVFPCDTGGSNMASAKLDGIPFQFRPDGVRSARAQSGRN